MSSRRDQVAGPTGPSDGDLNLAVVLGRLSRAPETRALRDGAQVTSFSVTTATDDGAENVPVVWYSPPRWATELAEGTDVLVVGRVRRRFFRAGAVLESRTEVVAAELASRRRPSAWSRAVRLAAERFAAGPSSAASRPRTRARP